jgi:hypothetical protein
MWQYNVVKNELSLLDDAAAKYLGPITPSSGTTLQNSQCTIGGPGTSVTGAGTTLTVVLPIKASSLFGGARKVYLYSKDMYGVQVGWDQRATWTLPISGTPSFGTVTPSSGTGTGATFTFTFNHSAGYLQLTSIYGMFSTSTSSVSACMWKYTQANNSLWLLNDPGNAYLGPLSPASTSTLQNGQCAVGGSGTSVTMSADTITVILPVSFSGSFAGAKKLYLYASDALNQAIGFTQVGTWTIPGGSAPAVDSVTPSSGSGTSAALSFGFSHSGGYTRLTYVYGLMQSTLSVTNACMWKFSPANGSMWLLSDNASTYLGPVTAGGSGKLANSQCTIEASSIAATGSGNTLTVNLTESFPSSFGGLKNIYLDAVDVSGLETGFYAKGTWTIPGGSTPSVVSVTPSSGSGSSAILTYRFSDTGGSNQLAAVFGLIQDQVSLPSSCMWKYVQATNSFYLLNDAATAYIGPLTGGGSGSLQNSQCTLIGTSVTPSGNDLDVLVWLSFSQGFTGAKNLYMYAQDANTSAAGWTSRGTWTTP